MSNTHQGTEEHRLLGPVLDKQTDRDSRWSDDRHIDKADWMYQPEVEDPKEKARTHSERKS
jgi:hypothetical protein